MILSLVSNRTAIPFQNSLSTKKISNQFSSIVCRVAISQSAVIFLLFVCFILVILIVLILYFEKVCCFARYRFLKYFLRRITRTKKSQSPVITTSLAKIEENKTTSSSAIVPDYLYIAGQREDRTTFIDTTSVFVNDSSKRINLKDISRNEFFHHLLEFFVVVVFFFIILVNSSETSAPQYFLS